jgi:hypothetical protein
MPRARPDADPTARPSNATEERPSSPRWRRTAAGSYRSADDRFSIDSEGSGRWFVRDAEQPDDFGQPRTTGPFATLDDAKAAADDQRGHTPTASPLAKRLAGSGDGGARRGTGVRAAGARRAGSGGVKAARARKPATWLDRLEERDRPAARRARALVRALTDAGIGDAEEVVRRDIEGGRPTMTEAALAQALHEAIANAVDPDQLVAAARRIPGLDVDANDLAELATLVAARVVEAMLGEISVGEGRERRGRDLPGWQLTEDAGERRRLVITPSDVLRSPLNRTQGARRRR